MSKEIKVQDKIKIYKTLVLEALADKANYDKQIKVIDIRNAILSSTPDLDMIEELNGAKYVPVSIIEQLLDALFTPFGWSHKITDTQIVANELIVSSVLICTCPITGQTIERAGIAADMVRMTKDAMITDISKKIKNALKMDAPHAKADALKNAAMSLGDIFGRNLNRKSGVSKGREIAKGSRVSSISKQLPQSAKLELSNEILQNMCSNINAIQTPLELLKMSKAIVKELKISDYTFSSEAIKMIEDAEKLTVDDKREFLEVAEGHYKELNQRAM